MKNRAKASVPAQVGGGLLFTTQQLLMIEGIGHSRRELFSWIQQVGISALQELFEMDAVELVGPRGLHRTEPSHYRWGTARIVLRFGGRRIVVPCRRVRGACLAARRSSKVRRTFARSIRCPRGCSTRCCSGSRPAVTSKAWSRCRPRSPHAERARVRPAAT